MSDKKSNYGVFYNTSDSDIFFLYDNLKFYFSSEFYKRKFIEELENYVHKEYTKIFNRYHIINDMDLYLVFSLYEKIEKRGYKVENIETEEVLVNNNYLNTSFKSIIDKE